MSWILAYFGPGQPLYLLFFAAMIIFFTYFYTLNVAFKPDDVADNLKNQNGFMPGIRPGKNTEEYLEYVVHRILVLGASYLALVCLIPEIVRGNLAITAYFGGTSILIIVSVGMDFIQQVQSHLAGPSVRRADREIPIARQKAWREEKGQLNDEYNSAGPSWGRQRDAGPFP